MTAHLLAVENTRAERDTAEDAFRDALTDAREAGCSWRSIAAAAGLSKTGTMYLVNAHNDARREQEKTR